MADENKTDSKGDKQEYVQPLTTSENERIKPLIIDSPDDNRKFKIYIEKLGYPWKMNDKEGLAQRLCISLAKLDMQGDIVGQKKRLNLPILIEDDLKKLFVAIKEANRYNLVGSDGEPIQ